MDWKKSENPPPRRTDRSNRRIPHAHCRRRLSLSAEPLTPIEVAGRAAALLPVGIRASKLVIAGALFLIAQYLISLVDLLELFLGLFIAGVAVRVILHGQFAIGLADVVRAGRAFHA